MPLCSDRRVFWLPKSFYYCLSFCGKESAKRNCSNAICSLVEEYQGHFRDWKIILPGVRLTHWKCSSCSQQKNSLAFALHLTLCGTAFQIGLLYGTCYLKSPCPISKYSFPAVKTTFKSMMHYQNKKKSKIPLSILL